MFFVDDDDTDLRKRCEQSRSGTDDDIQLTVLCPLVLIIALAVREFRMQDGYPLSESCIEAHQRLKGQRDLRDQDDRLLSLRDDAGDQFHIHFGLAAAGDAVDQRRSWCLFPHPRTDLLHHGLLPSGELCLFLCALCPRLRCPVLSCRLDPDDAVFLGGL